MLFDELDANEDLPAISRENKINETQNITLQELKLNSDDNKKNDTIIDEKTLPPLMNNIDNKFNRLLNSEVSETNEKMNIENDDLFDNFGFNQELKTKNIKL